MKLFEATRSWQVANGLKDWTSMKWIIRYLILFWFNLIVTIQTRTNKTKLQFYQFKRKYSSMQINNSKKVRKKILNINISHAALSSKNTMFKKFQNIKFAFFFNKHKFCRTCKKAKYRRVFGCKENAIILV